MLGDYIHIQMKSEVAVYRTIRHSWTVSQFSFPTPIGLMFYFSLTLSSLPVSFLAHDEHLRIVQYHVVSTILCRRSLCCTVCLPCPSRLVRPVVRPVPNVFLSLHKNTERISMKFAGGSHYHHEQIK